MQASRRTSGSVEGGGNPRPPVWLAAFVGPDPISRSKLLTRITSHALAFRAFAHASLSRIQRTGLMRCYPYVQVSEC